MSNARLGLPLAPSWPPTGQTYRVRYRYLTEVFTSHSGKERRIARRTNPRRSLEFASLFSGDQFREFKALLRSGQHLPVMLPEVTRSAVVVTPQSEGATSLELLEVPAWVAPGARMWAGGFSESAEVLTVDEVTGTTVSFTSELVHPVPVGAELHPALTGYLAASVAVPRRTNTVASAQIDFTVDPLSEKWDAPGSAEATFNGREVFLRRPNWANPVSMTGSRTEVVVDYGVGPVARYSPVDFGEDTYQATYLNRNREEASALVDFFRRMKGRQGEFYMPTWEPDFVPAGTSTSGSSTMVAEGRGAFDTYSQSTAYDAMFVLLNNGQLLFRRILDVTAAPGGNSQISVSEPWGHLITKDTVVMCGWLPVWRFASDNLTVEWLTNSVANILLNIVSLESLPAETT